MEVSIVSTRTKQDIKVRAVTLPEISGGRVR